MWEQSLSGLIKALRANKRDEHRVIAQALAEIGDEVRSKEWDIKAAAVLKLTYLEMLGHPTLLKHSFPVIECMSSPKFHIKQIGYLAASQSFAASTEVILLVHNLIKKDLTTSAHPSTVILALTSLPTLLEASPQLAEDLLPDLLRMLTHSKPPVRRIATLVSGKVWALQHSVALEFGHVEKLRAGLTDPDPSVISATVNVMLELARSRPDSLGSLLGLAPDLFDLLTESTNNWMLIKIVKLFAILTPIEPRLVRKLLPPLTNLISSTPAFSLLYECIQTVITGGMLSSSGSSEQASLATTCIDKLSAFLSDSDQNLRYIALKGLSRLLATGHAHLLSQHYDEILTCVDEEDLTIRLKALELIERLTDRSTCKEVVRRLLAQISPNTQTGKGKGKAHTRSPSQPSAAAALRAISSSYDNASPSGMATDAPNAIISSAAVNMAFSNYRYRLLLLILRLTSRSSDDGTQLYVNISNFEWYLDSLVTVAYLSLSFPPPVTPDGQATVGARVAEALLDVTARATSIREVAVKKMRTLLVNEAFSAQHKTVDSRSGHSVRAVNDAAAFIVSEYASPIEAKQIAELLYTKSSQSSVCALCAAKSTARWLQGLSGPSWSEDAMSSVKEHLEEGIVALEKNEETPYLVQLLRTVRDQLDGQRLSPIPDGLVAEPTSPQADPENDDPQPEDPSHNPFASSARSNAEPDNSMHEKQGAPACLVFLSTLFFVYNLLPLADNAQAAVPVPDGLDLGIWIGQPLDNKPSYLDYEESDSDDRKPSIEVDGFGRPKSLPIRSDSPVYTSASGKAKKPKRKDKAKDAGNEQMNDDVDDIPIVKLDLEGDGLLSPRLNGSSSSAALSERGSRKNKRRSPVLSRARTPSPPPLILAAGGDMPTARPHTTSAKEKVEPTKISGGSAPDLVDVEPAEERPNDSITAEHPPIKVVKSSKKVKKKPERDQGEDGVKVKKKKKSSSSNIRVDEGS